MIRTQSKSRFRGFEGSARRALAVVVAAACLAPALPARAGEFTVLTYNVQGLPPILGDRTGRMEAVAQSLERYRASIAERARGAHGGPPRSFIALQEVFSRRYRDLLRPSGYPFASRKSDRGWAGLGDGLLLLSDLRVESFERTQWKDCCGSFGRARSDCDAAKGFTSARLFLEDDVSVDVYVVHAEAGMDPGSRKARCDNYRQLVDAIEERSPKGRAVLVLGDTNGRFTRGDENLHDLVRVAGLTDVWVQMKRGGKAPAAGEPIRSACLTEPASSECELKDKVLYRSGDGLELAPQTYETLHAMFSDRRGRGLSDHHPISVRFRYTKTRGAADLAGATLLPPASPVQLAAD